MVGVPIAGLAMVRGVPIAGLTMVGGVPIVVLTMVAGVPFFRLTFVGVVLPTQKNYEYCRSKISKSISG